MVKPFGAQMCYKTFWAPSLLARPEAKGKTAKTAKIQPKKQNLLAKPEPKGKTAKTAKIITKKQNFLAKPFK